MWGWGLAVQAVKGFTRGRTQDMDVYGTHREGAAGRTVRERRWDEVVVKGPQLQGRVREQGNVGNVLLFGNLRNCAWL